VFETVDDVEFLTELAEYLRGEYDLSRDYVFSTGMSNGGDMSYLLACEASEIFRAIAPVAGCMMTWIYDSCDPIDPIPVFEIHGTDDDVTWWEGADEIFNDGWGPWESVDTTFNFWIQLNGCTDFTMDTLPDINTSDGSYVISHKNTNGVNNNEVWLYEVVNGGHDWPGAYGNMDINSSEEIWNFFTNFIDNSLGITNKNEIQKPNIFLLQQNYPNPFNPVTTLLYSLTEENMVKITVYDMLGRKVRTLVNTLREAGRWSIRWDATNDQGGTVLIWYK
jgi:polyhydroxybutyrate depolymerase